MRLISIVLLAILPQIAFCQKSDSSRIKPVVKWKLDRLLDVYHYDYPACRNSVDTLSIALDSAKYAIQKGSELIELRTLERDLKVKEVEAYENLTTVNTAIHKIELRTAEKKGRKTGLKIGAATIIVIEIGRALLRR